MAEQGSKGFQSHAANWIAELAQRDAQPVPGADPHHRIGVKVTSSPARMPVRASHDEPVAGSLLALSAAISLAASRSSRNFGSGSGFGGYPRR